MAVSVKLLFFAKARELVGESETRLRLDSADEVTTAGALKKAVLAAYPQLAPIGANVILAFNHEYVLADDEIHLRDDDEVAVIPPISGG